MMSYQPRDLYTIAELTTSFEVDGHRADIVILKTALAHAAFRLSNNGAEPVDLLINDLDILAAAELALPHRLKRQPFQDTEGRLEELSSRLQESRIQLQDAKPPGATMSEPAPTKKKT
jgi:Mg-chelatase subunit ChlI